MIQCNHKIAVIIVFFGNWPKWIEYFLHTCNKRSELNFIIFSDNQIPKRFNNITWHEFSLQEFSKLVNTKLELEVSINKAYKVCDFKPAFGEIFEDYLKGFDFWAYSDIDLIFGDFMLKEIYSTLEQTDVFSFYPGFASGPFCIYRNRKDINLLFTQIKDYRLMLGKSDCQGIDEHIIRAKNVGFSFRKFVLFIGFLLRYSSTASSDKKTFNQFKYEFQWYVKENTINEPVDISEVILLNHSQKRIKAKFKNLILNDEDFIRNKIDDWKIIFKNGKIIDSEENQHAIFHFIKSKKHERFKVNDLNEENSNFKIDSNGFRTI